jgi:hypothetical protein
MSKRIVCTICGATVITFSQPDDVDPERLFAVLEHELAKHRDVVDSELAANPAAVAEGPSAPGAAQWNRTLHLFTVVDDADHEVGDLEEELENPELFYYGDMAGWW